MRGAQIVFPLSGNVIVSMWDADLFNHQNYREERFQWLAEADRDLFDWYQMINSEEQVFCADNHFERIQQLLNLYKGLPQKMQKPRIQVH